MIHESLSHFVEATQLQLSGILQLAYLTRYMLHCVHLHSHHDKWIPNSFKEHMDLEQALLQAEQFQLRLLAHRTANFVDVSMEMIMGFWW